jgi:hypothetical protein
MGLVDGGVLTIPLHHGTSSIFLESILMHGLGAVDPIQTYDAFKFLRRVHEIAGDMLYGTDPAYDTWRPLVESMLRQQASFRHGTSFLSPSRLTAVRYALNNRPLGSELLNTASTLYEMIERADKKRCSDPILAKSAIPTLKSHNPKPIVLVALKIQMKSLRGEGNGDAAENVKILEELADPETIEVMGQQTNFESTVTIPSDQLKAYEIIAPEEINPFFPKYSLREIGNKKDSKSQTLI